MDTLTIPGILLVIAVLLSLIIVSREIVTWYWKLSEIVSILKNIEKNTRKENKDTDDNKKNLSNSSSS